jgi:hypothetical protein
MRPTPRHLHPVRSSGVGHRDPPSAVIIHVSGTLPRQARGPSRSGSGSLAAPGWGRSCSTRTRQCVLSITHQPPVTQGPAVQAEPPCNRSSRNNQYDRSRPRYHYHRTRSAKRSAPEGLPSSDPDSLRDERTHFSQALLCETNPISRRANPFRPGPSLRNEPNFNETAQTPHARGPGSAYDRTDRDKRTDWTHETQ